MFYRIARRNYILFCTTSMYRPKTIRYSQCAIIALLYLLAVSADIYAHSFFCEHCFVTGNTYTDKYASQCECHSNVTHTHDIQQSQLHIAQKPVSHYFSVYNTTVLQKHLPTASTTSPPQTYYFLRPTYVSTQSVVLLL
jgi:hypothetical protein